MRDGTDLDALINLHTLVAPTLCNGPGRRAAIFVQGCSLSCPGCHNPQTWPHRPRKIVDAAWLVEWLRARKGLRGVTLSGGEPFEQAYGLTAVCRALRRDGLDVIAFSGFTHEEIEGGIRPHSADLLREIDVLVDGRYIEASRGRYALRGSANQRIHVRTDRILPSELEEAPKLEWIGREGGAHVTGFGMGALERIVGAHVRDESP